MAGKTSKKQTKTVEKGNSNQKAAQILFAVFAIILILSMVLSAVANYYVRSRLVSFRLCGTALRAAIYFAHF